VKYVALLSFNSISLSHPHLVATHQAIIFDCLDDPDISIRSQALVLCSRMINSENIVAIIDKLLQQIRTIPVSKNFSGKDVEGSLYHVEPVADSDGEDPTETLKPDRASRDEVVPLPHEYCISVIESIIDMCSRDTYSNILDFNWYLDILLELVGKIPQDAMPPNALQRDALPRHIGAELRNVAVRVISVRAHAVSSAASLLEVSGGMTWPTAQTPGTSSILAYAAWIVGEYADYLSASTDILEVLLYHGNHALDAEVLCAFLQAIPKVLVRKLYLLGSQWDKEQRAVVSLLFARVIQFLDILAFHPSLDVQERATEFLELFRVSREAIYSQERDSIAPPPLLLTAVFPSLFIGMVLGPVSGLAQRKVPMPAGLDLESPLNSNLPDLLIRDEVGALPKRELVDVHRLYYQKPAISVAQQLRESSLLEHNLGASEVQRRNGDTEQQMSAYQKLHRNQRTRDDPYYIGKDDHSNRRGLMQIEDILRSNNDQDVDIDAIPIMDLDLGGDAEKPDKKILAVKRQHTATSRVHITADENIDGELTSQHDGSTTVSSGRGASHQRRGFLQINATGIGDFTMEHADDIGKSSPHMGVRGVEDDHEMTRALAEVETLRMEMQRAAERVEAGNIPDEGTLVKKKTKKPKKKLVQGEPSHNTKNDLVRNTKRDVEYHGRGEKQKKNKRKKASEPHVVQAA
jgi:AP-3 complex subunit delta-1